MNYFDVILVILISIITIRGLIRGLITELMILIALILGFFIATFYLSDVSGLLIQLFPSLPEAGARILAFIVLFLTVNITIRLLSRMLNQFAKFTFLQPVNKIAGAAFAFLKVVLILSIVFLIVDLIPHSEILLKRLHIDQSLLFNPIKMVAPGLYSTLVYVLPDHKQVYDEFLDMFNRADTTARTFIHNR
jgi:membrane protein required for colicin V production